MASHNRLSVNVFDTASIDRAIAFINQRYGNRRMEAVFINVLERVAEVGRNAAQNAYGSTVSVSVRREDDKVYISCNGEQVVFQEFGSGDTVAQNRYSEMMPFDVSSGSYSRAYHGTYYSRGYWYHNGARYQFITPKGGIVAAVEVILRLRNLTVNYFTEF